MLRTWFRRYTDLLWRFLRSKRTFWVLFGICGLEAIWIAVSGAYSMAYDEYVHYGVMKIYTHQWSPFFTSQPPGADAFGALARDPSYMYHYLMSFPLRLFGHAFSAFSAQIIFLRLFDVAFFLGGVLLFRKAFKAAQVSNIVSNVALGFFLALPVVPFMAAQVNYDDLLFLLTGASGLLAVTIIRTMQTSKVLPLKALLGFVAVIAFASLVKYAFAPILLALSVGMLVFVGKAYGWKPVIVWQQIRQQSPRLKSVSGVLLILVTLLSLGLFIERYGVNTLRYHTPTPECDQVMSLEKCQLYEPYARNYAYHQGNYALPTAKIAAYPFNNWLRGMVRSLFFTVGNKESGYPAGEPMLLAQATGWVVVAGGIILLFVRGRWLWRAGAVYKLFLAIVVTYAGVLFLQNFFDFLHTHVPVAIQGRYLVPILPIFLLLVARTVAGLRLPKQLTAVVLTLLMVGMVEGGGAVPYIIRFQDAWLWDAPIVRTVQHGLQDIISPLVIGEKR